MIMCSKCNKEFAYNYLLLKHQNRKKSCVSINNNESINNNDIINNNESINTNEFINNNESTKEKDIDNLDNPINNNPSIHSEYSDNNQSIDESVDEFVDDNIKKKIKEGNIIKKIERNEKNITKIDKKIKIIENKLNLHMKNSIKNLKCNECNKIFSRKFCIMRHINERCEYIKNIEK